MSHPRIVVRRGKDRALQNGYPWVFANQIDRARSDAPASGEVVRIEGDGGRAYGLGLFHATSLIAVRFLSSNSEAVIGPDFFRDRIRRAIQLRRAAFPSTTHVRLIFGESDGMPGTLVDRYGPPGFAGGVLTWSCLSFGMEAHRDSILDILEDELRPEAVVERNDASLRPKDGLDEQRGVLRGALPERIELDEDGARFEIDVLNGPKTGFFIDQRMNRLAIRPFAAGRRVLDVFSADGGFGIQAALSGARHVHMIDASADALRRARRNAELSGVADRVTTEAADALDRLGELLDEDAAYDFVILDPPSFASSRRHVEAATRAYQRLNISALRLLPPGGMLASSSCSQAIDEEGFVRMLRYCAKRANARLRLLYRGGQPADHPVLESMPETHYLKCYLLQKLEDEVPA